MENQYITLYKTNKTLTNKTLTNKTLTNKNKNKNKKVWVYPNIFYAKSLMTLKTEEPLSKFL